MNEIDKFDLDEVTIDANFILRFEPYFSSTISELRSKMRYMFGASGDEPLTGDAATSWFVGLYDHVPKGGGFVSSGLVRSDFRDELSKAAELIYFYRYHSNHLTTFSPTQGISDDLKTPSKSH